ncbi:UBP-type domain-containing protein [Aphelenchoides besseyi]|nr:UBP-type domain-containing protein [Aphelenchoides besseyi]
MSDPSQETAPASDHETREYNRFDLSAVSNEETELDLTQTISNEIPEISRFTQLKSLTLRTNLIKGINNRLDLTSLTELDLYDNQIEGLNSLTKLRKLYFVHNKIEKIEGLETLVNLEYLELGDNRIAKIENLDNNTRIQNLFLGANRIRQIENLGHLQELVVLSLQANAITQIQGLEALTGLKELYLSQNGNRRNFQLGFECFSYHARLEFESFNENPKHWSLVQTSLPSSIIEMSVSQEQLENLEVQPSPDEISVNQPCKTCGVEGEVWICLTCYEVNCGRFVGGHALEHASTTKHAMALSFSDLSSWCYECNAYVHNDVLAAAKNAAYKNKFGEGN